ncbi:MAG: deoxyguanosinetriphosphate triphosphohydrolase [Candidatus Gastranaerophilales bacterium]|nr:deoxyguanosinetriphosphate triphosphohydrolase [Candidatus Gastranaerophilales bacterium]
MTIFSPAELKNRQFELEDAFLSPFATKSSKTLGRETPEESCPLRTEFQRDRDRIIHSKAFRRLKHKTQVFFSPEDDHYRTRLTHTLEVAQISRTMARFLRLNEDLTEAIALGHDLGHTPFGHSGEAALDEIIEGGFRHSEQSVRVVRVVEPLNLTKETLDGILNHSMGISKAFTLEGQVVKLSDKIAYLNHDLDDAVRAGLIKISDIPQDIISYLGSNRGEMVNTMVTNIVMNSMDKNEIAMSSDCEEVMLSMRKWMFDNVYLDSKAKTEEGKIKRIIKELFNYYCAMLQDVSSEADRKEIELTVKDYIAGMTDRYAVKKYRQLFIPRPMTVSIDDNNLISLAKQNGVV